MPTIASFDVAIGTTDKWYVVEVVPVDNSRVLNNSMTQESKEFRYWRVEVTENGVTQTLEGRLKIAGLRNSSPGQAIRLSPGLYRTWTRVRNIDEEIITKAGVLTMT